MTESELFPNHAGLLAWYVLYWLRARTLENDDKRGAVTRA